jgi:allantoin racemase
MEEQCVKAIEEDGADTLVLGCTSLSWMVPEVRAGLKERGHEAPVIQPIRAAVMFARALVAMGMAHSPVAYPQAVPKASAIVR